MGLAILLATIMIVRLGVQIQKEKYRTAALTSTEIVLLAILMRFFILI